MTTDQVARAETIIKAPVAKVWDALVNPEIIKSYMFGATVVTDWKKGSKIVWRGEWKGKQFEDKGQVLDVEPGRRLSYSHFSPLTGEPDAPENYHHVTIALAGGDGEVRVELSQDNNKSEKARDESVKNWQAMLAAMKQAVEGKKPATD